MSQYWQMGYTGSHCRQCIEQKATQVLMNVIQLPLMLIHPTSIVNNAVHRGLEETMNSSTRTTSCEIRQSGRINITARSWSDTEAFELKSGHHVSQLRQCEHNAFAMGDKAACIMQCTVSLIKMVSSKRKICVENCTCMCLHQTLNEGSLADVDTNF